MIDPGSAGLSSLDPTEYSPYAARTVPDNSAQNRPDQDHFRIFANPSSRFMLTRICRKLEATTADLRTSSWLVSRFHPEHSAAVLSSEGDRRP